MATSPPQDNLPARINYLENLIREIARNPNYPFSVVGPTGTRYFSVSPGVSGTPVTKIRMGIGGKIYDGAGNIIFSADQASGQRLSTPFLTVPLSPQWDGGIFQAYNAGAVTQSLGRYTIVANSVLAETTMWEGMIPQVLHPKMKWSGVVGRATGTTSTPTYKLYVGGVIVKTWSLTAPTNYDSGDIDITGVAGVGFGFEQVGVKLTISCTPTSNDHIYCHSYGVVMLGR